MDLAAWIVRGIKRRINLLPGPLYLALKCKSAAIRLAHWTAASGKAFRELRR